MKKISFFKYCLLAVMAIFMVAFTGCKDDDDDDDPPVFVEDGLYLTGPATGLDGLKFEGMMDDGREEGEGFASNLRTGMYEKFIYLSAGNFNVVQRAGAAETTWGWDGSGAQTLVLDGTNDQIDGTVAHGTVTANGTAFNVANAGLYHVIVDVSTSKVFYTQVTKWAVIGDATDFGWSSEIAMTQKSLTATAGEWEVTNVTLRERGGYKFRYNSGWKISTDDLIIFANIGKGDTNNDFLMGGPGFDYPTAGEGAYTINLKWSFADGWSYTATRTGAVDPLPEYPETLYMIGDGLGNGGWDWAEVDMPMIPIHSNPQLFWKIVWMNETGAFEFSPVKDWNGNFGGKDGIDGIYDFNPGGGNAIPVPGTAGYYMVVVNLEDEKIAIVDPKVYLIGNTVESWDTANPETLFTVDNENENVTITKDLKADELRMHVWFNDADWFTKPLGEGTQVSWWQVEFIILDGKIEFRGTGGDQARVNVEEGNYTIDLNFKEGTGTITKN